MSLPARVAAHATSRVAATVPRAYVPTEAQIRGLRGFRIRAREPHKAPARPKVAPAPFRAALAEKVVTETLGHQELQLAGGTTAKKFVPSGGSGTGRLKPALIGLGA